MHERQTDRRQAHRRTEDRGLHYAREFLLAAALAWVEGQGDDDDATALVRARNAYRNAERKAREAVAS
jgi:gluconate kinase